MSKTLVRAFTLLVLSVVGVAACGGDDSDGGDATGATDVAPAEAGEAEALDPARPVVFYGTNVLSQWDPTKSTNQANDHPYFTQVYDRLLQLQADNTVAPALATAWEFSADGLTLTMELREDVVFHDGGAFDAQNAVLNLDRNRATGSILAPTLAAISDVTATGPYELQIVLAAADPTILYRLASTSSSMVSPAGLANVDALAAKPAGSGPFTFVKYDGTTVTLERNDDYWDKETLFPESKTIWAVTDDAARLNAVASGAADIATVRATQWAEVERMVAAGDVEAYQFGELAQYLVYVNANSGPLADPVTRRAISMSIDRETIDEALLNGLCASSSQVVPKGFVGHDEGLPAADEFDVEAAQELLDGAGIEPFAITALVGDTGLYVQLGQVVKDQLAAIGIDVELIVTPISQMRATWRQGAHDLMVFPYSPSTPDMLSLIGNDYLGADGLGVSLPELETLANEARPLEIGSSERSEALRQITEFLFEEPLHVPICQVPGIYVFQPGLTGVDRIPGHRLSANVPDSRTLIWSKE